MSWASPRRSTSCGVPVRFPPLMAENDQARLLRHLALMFAHFVMLRDVDEEARARQARTRNPSSPPRFKPEP